MRIAHCGITVANLDRSIKLYSDAFGFTLHNRVSRKDPWLASVVGAPGVHMHFAHMKLPNGNHLELIQYETPVPIEPVVTALPWRVGSQHLCLQVDDIEASTHAAIREGARMWSRDIEEIPDGPNRGARCVYLRGPSSELIELFEAAR